MSEEWGPWIEHDGKGVPVPFGKIAHMIFVDAFGVFSEKTAAVGSTPEARLDGGSWNWKNFPFSAKIIRYRIRKPRGLTILEGLLENLPEKVDA